METSVVQYLSLDKIFDGTRRFLIPVYQRGYSWQGDNWIDLWDDIYYLDKTHFMGQISVAKYPNSEKQNTYHVVDGQQRLTTLIILAKALFDSLKKNDDGYKEVDDKSIADWQKAILFKTNAKTNETECIFGYEQNDPSHEFFKKEILDIPDTPSIGEEDKNSLYNHNLKAAQEFFEGQFKSMKVKDKEGEIDKLTFFNRVFKKLMFNFFVVPDEINTNIVFDSMNNRGLGLSEMEKLKNRLFYISHCEELNLKADIQNTYIELYRQLGKNKKLKLEDDAFLSVHTTIYHSVIAEATDYIHKTIYSIKKLRNGDFSKAKNGQETIKDYIDSLAECIPYYYEIHAREQASDEEKRWWDSLVRLGAPRDKGLGRITPLVLALWIKKQDSEKRAGFLKTLERFIFLRELSSKSDYKEKENRRKAYRIYTGGEDPAKILEEIKNDIDEKIEQGSGLAGVLGKLIWGDWDDRWYFLYEWDIENRQNKTGYVKIDTKKDEVEHIYPQTPNPGDWLGINFGENVWLKNHIGNLVLLTKRGNGQASNNSFTKKIKIYQEDTEGARDIAKKYENWNNQTIYARGKALLEFFIRRWEIPEPSADTLDNALEKKELGISESG